MDERTFQTLARRAKLLTSDYGSGYQRGLRRHYHGERFGTPEEHALWMSLGTSGDPREELGRGYRAGFAGREPEPLRGRPPLPVDQRSDVRPRSVRLDDARWHKLQQLGREWLERAIDRAKA